MNVKALYKRVIEVLVDDPLVIVKHRYGSNYFGNPRYCQVAMHIYVLESGQYRLYPDYQSKGIYAKKYTYTRKSV